jgi:branched-subunit amino acid transport protein
MTAFLAVMLAGLGSYLLRGVFILALSERQFPPLVLRTLEYVSPAVMGALIVSMLTHSDGTVTLGAPELAGLSVAALLVYHTRNHVYSLLGAMAVYWLLAALVP